ncbi:MAG TPA: hypothetical protein VF767_02565 [Bryobacteraceae bacterium]
MRWLACLLVGVLGCPTLAADRGDRAECIGGTVAGLRNTDGYLVLTLDEKLVYQSGQFQLEVPYDSVNLLEYGQKVDRRYLMAIAISPLLLLSKKRKHFLTIGYTDEQGRQQALVFQVGKAHIRSVLASLEAKTGRKVDFQDLEARKAGAG